MIRVLIDGRCVRGALHGIARYTLALAQQLPRVAPDLDLAVLCHPDSAARFADAGVRVAPCAVEFTAPTAALALSRAERQLQPDVFFCPSFMVPLAPRAPLVLTLHDATHLVFPRDYRRSVGLFYRAVTLPAARRAAAVLTVSEFSAHSLRQYAGLDRIEAIHNGVDHSLFVPTGARDPRLGPRTLLYAGGYKPHKRAGLLVEALRQLPAVQLALAGVPPAALIEQAVASGVARRLQVLGDLSDQGLAAAYRAATLFVYPSAHEGFGLPPLEAMACGTPVVCANATSLPEVVADAAALFDGDAGALAAAIHRVLDDDDARRALVERGLLRSRCFTWQGAAIRVAEVLRRAAQSRGSGAGEKETALGR